MLTWLTQALRAGELTRHALARGWCERPDWRHTPGRWGVPAASKALPVLADRLGLAWPPGRSAPNPRAGPTVPADEVPDPPVAGDLAELGSVWGGAGGRPHRPSALGGDEGPASFARLVALAGGGQRWDWIRSECTGVLGGLGFGSATWPLRARDERIGGSKAARDANIQRVLCPHRFGMLPGVRVPGWASAGWRQAVPRGIDDRSPPRSLLSGDALMPGAG